MKFLTFRNFLLGLRGIKIQISASQIRLPANNHKAFPMHSFSMLFTPFFSPFLATPYFLFLTVSFPFICLYLLAIQGHGILCFCASFLFLFCISSVTAQTAFFD